MVSKIRIVFALRTDIKAGAGTEKTAYYYMKFLPRDIWDPYLLMTDYYDTNRLSLPMSKEVFEGRIIKIHSLEWNFLFIKRIPKIGYNLFDLLQYLLTFITKRVNRNILNSLNTFDVIYGIYFHSSFLFSNKGALIVGSEQTIGAVSKTNDIHSFLTLALHKVFFRRFDLIHKLSDQRMHAFYAGIPTFLLRSGYDPSIFYPRFDNVSETVQYYYIARLVPGKGLRTLLSAWQIAKTRSVKKIRLHIIGEGELSELIPLDDPTIVYHGFPVL